MTSSRGISRGRSARRRERSEPAPSRPTSRHCRALDSHSHQRKDATMPIIKGTNSGDTLYGTSAGDTISGLGGNDALKGFGGADFIDGGAGIDTVVYGDSTAGVSRNLATGRCFGGAGEGGTPRRT